MPSKTDIDTQELLAKVDSGTPFLLLDVRNADEFERWKIEGRRDINVVHIPYFDFIEDEQAAIDRVPNSEGEVVVVCAKGGSSEMVAEILRGSGVIARNLVGGMIAYGQYLEAVRVPLSPAENGVLEIWQFNRRGKGCLSYIITSGNEGIVVDPSRSTEVYESFLSKAGKRLVHVLDTHVHADHISGGPALADRLSVNYSVGAGAGNELRRSAVRLKDDDLVRIGSSSIRVVATPGHTPGSVCYLVGERYLLSGDTLFTRSVGRPDLGGHVVDWSKDLFKSLHERLALLPDDVIVLPAHYAEISEIGPDDVVSRSLGDLRRDLRDFQIQDVPSFINAMKNAVKTPPPEYAEIIAANFGNITAADEQTVEWELGKNQCAASTRS